MWEFSFTSRFTTNQTRCAGYWTAQHISTATCRTRNDDRSAYEKKKKKLLWLVSVCIWVSPVMRQYYTFGSWVTCGGCLRWALRKTRWDKTLGAVQNTRLCLGSTSTLAMWQRIAYLHYARGWHVRVTCFSIYTAVTVASHSCQYRRRAKLMKIDDEGTLRHDGRYV